MTVSANDRLSGPLLGNGVTVAFQYDFRIEANTELRVILRSVDGVDAIKNLTTDYSVSGVATDPGGNVTFVTAPATGEKVIIEGVKPQTQTVNYVDTERFPYDSHQAGMDKLERINQEQQRDIDRTVKFAHGEAAYRMPLKPDGGVALLGRSSTGEIVHAASADFGSGTPVAADWLDIFAQDPSAVLDDLRGARICATYGVMTALTLASGLADGGVYATLTRTNILSINDGSAGNWRFKLGDSTTANGGTILADDANTGRFFRIFDSSNFLLDWFCVGDGVTSDNTAFRAAVTATGANTLRFGADKTYLITATELDGIAGQHWRGAGMHSSILKWAATTSFEGILFLGKSDWSIKDVGFDHNNCTNSVLAPTLTATQCDNWEIEDCDFSHFTSLCISVDAVKNWSISRNHFLKDAITNDHNQAINIGLNTGPTINGKINANTCKGSAIYSDGDSLEFIGNYINGFGYGSAICLGTSSLTGTINCRVIGNWCTGGTGIDENVVYCPGLEVWSPRSEVVGNHCWNNSGNGLHAGGKHSVVTHNICWDNGLEPVGGGNGLIVRYVDADQNGSNSIYAHNRCFDTGGGTQKYGLTEESPLLTHTTITDNDCHGNATAPMVLQALLSTFRGPILSAAVTWDPASCASGSIVAVLVTVTGVALGDYASAAIETDVLGLTLAAAVTQANRVQVILTNNSGITQDIGSTTLRVRAEKPKNHADF